MHNEEEKNVSAEEAAEAGVKAAGYVVLMAVATIVGLLIIAAVIGSLPPVVR